jgi:hypothetical protein
VRELVTRGCAAGRAANEFGIDHVSMIEFGLAGGNSLLALERLAGVVEAHFPVAIDMYWFETGRGLPRPVDARDLPNLWTEGAFPMDAERQQSRLTRAQLVFGLVEKTKPAPPELRSLQHA